MYVRMRFYMYILCVQIWGARSLVLVLSVVCTVRIIPCVALGALATYTPGQLYVLRHDGYTFGVDRAQIGVLE